MFRKQSHLKLLEVYNLIKQNDKITNRLSLENIIRLRLRELIAELEFELILENSLKVEILFGFDYYMYIKSNIDITNLLSEINKIGLFIN